MRLLTLLASSILLLSACASQPTAGEASGKVDVPSDWFAVPAKDWRYQALSPETKSMLATTQATMLAEQSSSAYQFFLEYSTATKSLISKTNESATRNFLSSWIVVSRNLTPEMDGLEQDWNDYTRNDNAINNANGRALRDDWARMWMMDKPTTLTPLPLSNATGNP
ncbi:MAG: hypothetical protein O2800_03760 [Planctomycetota bacterium]|nr:hypothetical protein [Planctomycetota bacterium]